MKEPIQLAAGFEWSILDLTNDAEVLEVYQLLKENYVEDSENTFRYHYPVEFIQWSLL